MSQAASQPPVQRAFFHPGGFAKLDAKPLSDAQRLRWLIGMFARMELRSLTSKLTAISFPLGAFAGAAVIALLTRIPQLMEMLGDDRRVFVTDKAMPILFGMNLLTAFLQTTIWVAPVIASDVQSGALLLYFSRPLRRRDYLLARLLAATLVTWAELASAAVLLVLVQMASFGTALDGGTTLGGIACCGRGVELSSAIAFAFPKPCHMKHASSRAIAPREARRPSTRLPCSSTRCRSPGP